MLCVDYKIGTKALAARLQRVLPSVLQEDQTCGVPGRSIVSNLNQIKSNHIYSQIPKYIFGYLCTGEYKGNEKGAT